MIWFTLSVFVISFYLTVRLTPKPQLENARAGKFKEVNFPKASDGAPIPWIGGKVRLRSPNTLWYGHFRSEEITKTVNTGVFSEEEVVVGYKYYLGFDLGICLGPNV